MKLIKPFISNFHGNHLKKNKLNKNSGKMFRNVSYDALSYCLLVEGKIDVEIESNIFKCEVIEKPFFDPKKKITSKSI